MSPKAPDGLEILGDRLRNLDLEGFSKLRVLVAGDFMLDEYLWGKVERVLPGGPGGGGRGRTRDPHPGWRRQRRQ